MELAMIKNENPYATEDQSPSPPQKLAPPDTNTDRDLSVGAGRGRRTF